MGPRSQIIIETYAAKFRNENIFAFLLLFIMLFERCIMAILKQGLKGRKRDLNVFRQCYNVVPCAKLVFGCGEP